MPLLFFLYNTCPFSFSFTTPRDSLEDTKVCTKVLCCSQNGKLVVPLRAKDERFGVGSCRIRWLIHTHQRRANATASERRQLGKRIPRLLSREESETPKDYLQSA